MGHRATARYPRQVDAFIRLTIEDTLAFYNPAIGDYTWRRDRTATSDWYYTIPAGWLAEDGQLPAARLEALLCGLYGPRWRQGNADGSRYVVVQSAVTVLDALPPASVKGSRFRVGADGVITRVRG